MVHVNGKVLRILMESLFPSGRAIDKTLDPPHLRRLLPHTLDSV